MQARLNPSSSSERRGSALFAVVPALVLIMALMMAFMGTVTSQSTSTEGAVAQFEAESAARTVISLVAEEIWSDFDAATSVDSAQIWDFQTYLESRGMADMSGVEEVERADLLPGLDLGQDQQGRSIFAGTVIESLTAYRLDTWDATSLVVEATAVSERGRDAGRRYSVQEVFSIAPPEWGGLDYAMLANNINCILCHTNIDNAERFYNTDESKRGSFDAVRVGTIESLHFRSNPDSQIAGSLYVGGDAIKGDGTNISDWSAFNLKAAEADSDGQLVEDAWGGLTYDDLRRPDPDDDSVDANLFLGADLVDGAAGEGFLPDEFPSPFPDNGGLDPDTGTTDESLAGNRIIDDAEFDAKVGGLTGSISGGRISLVEKGDSIDRASELSALRNGTDTSVRGVVDQHVYLHGEKNDPLVLNGDIAVDGDVVISGYVKGEGTIQARGNVYIPADLLYADGQVGGDRTYRTADDGTRNTLAIAAGGNILVGDFYKPAWDRGAPTTGDESGSFSFLMDEIAIFNRMEWIKTQETLPGENAKVQVGTKTVWKDEYEKKTWTETVPKYAWQKTGEKKKQAVYRTVKKTTGSPPYQKTTTEKVFSHYKWVDVKEKVQVGTRSVTKTKWVKTGNKVAEEKPVYEWQTPEHANPYYQGADYVARFYTFQEGVPAPIFNKEGHFDPQTKHWISEERAGSWDDSKLDYADPSDPNDPYLFNADGSPRAVLSSMTPENDWIDRDHMQKLIDLNLAQRGNKNAPFQINGSLYSSNAIFGLIAKKGHTRGTLLINGGVVAADVGLLAPSGTQLNFDGAGAKRLDLTASQGLTMRRNAVLPLPRS